MGQIDAPQIDCKWKGKSCVVDDHKPESLGPQFTPNAGNGRRSLDGDAFPIYNTKSPRHFCYQFSQDECGRVSWTQIDAPQIDCKWRLDNCIVDDHMPETFGFNNQPGMVPGGNGP